MGIKLGLARPSSRIIWPKKGNDSYGSRYRRISCYPQIRWNGREERDGDISLRHIIRSRNLLANAAVAQIKLDKGNAQGGIMDLSCSETKCSSIWVRNNPPLRKMENQSLKLGITKSKDQVPNSLLLNPVSSKSPSYFKGICQRIGYLLWFSYMKCLKLTKKKTNQQPYQLHRSFLQIDSHCLLST